MRKILFSLDFNINKTERVIEDLINDYWKIFIEKNKKRKELVFVKKSEIVKFSKIKRRNCYKHLSHLVSEGIFTETENYIFPSSLILNLKNRKINPTEIIFNTKITKNTIQKGIISINPKISTDKIKTLSNFIFVGEKTLYNYLSFSSHVEINLSSSIRLSKIPKIRKIGYWNQKDKKILKKEKKLLESLSPNKDPFGHNCYMELQQDDSTPFIELEDNEREYVFSGWCSQLVYNGQKTFFKGDFSEKGDTGAKVLFYNSKKELLSEKKFVFPSSSNGIPIADMSPLLFLRKDYRFANKDYLGFYDFKNESVENRYRMNHIIVHFSKLNAPKNAKFLKIKSGKTSILTIMGIILKNNFDNSLIRERMNNIRNGKFIQDSIEIMPSFNFKEIDSEKYKEINKILEKASFSNSKEREKLTIDSLERIIEYVEDVKKYCLNDINKIKKIKSQNELIKSIYPPLRITSHLYSNIKTSSNLLDKKISNFFLDNFRFYKKIIPFLKKTDSGLFSLLMEAKYICFFSLLRRGDSSLIKESLFEIKRDLKLIENDFNKLHIIRSFIPILNKNIEENIPSKDTKLYLDYLIWLNEERSNILRNLSIEIKNFKKRENFDQEYIENKYNHYKTLSLYYLFQNIIIQSKNISRNFSEDENLKRLDKLLFQFRDNFF